MAGHDDRPGIAAQRLADRLGPARIAEPRGERAIGDGFAGAGSPALRGRPPGRRRSPCANRARGRRNRPSRRRGRPRSAPSPPRSPASAGRYGRRGSAAAAAAPPRRGPPPAIGCRRCRARPRRSRTVPMAVSNRAYPLQLTARVSRNVTFIPASRRLDSAPLALYSGSSAEHRHRTRLLGRGLLCKGESKMKPTRKLSRRSFLGRVAGGAIAGGAALTVLGAPAEALQVTDSDSGPNSDPPGRGRGNGYQRQRQRPQFRSARPRARQRRSATATAAPIPIRRAAAAAGAAPASPTATPAAMPIRAATAAAAGAPASPTAIPAATPIRPATAAAGAAGAAAASPTATAAAGPIRRAADAAGTTDPARTRLRGRRHARRPFCFGAPRASKDEIRPQFR